MHCFFLLFRKMCKGDIGIDIIIVCPDHFYTVCTVSCTVSFHGKLQKHESLSYTPTPDLSHITVLIKQKITTLYCRRTINFDLYAKHFSKVV